MSNYRLDSKPSSLYTPASECERVFGYARKITGIVIHHWGADGQSHDAIAGYLGRAGGNSSAHEVISAGRVTTLVPHEHAAWHAGNSEANAKRIGLECRPEMSDGDWDTLVERCADIEEIHGSMYYSRHLDHSATACPGRYADQIMRLIDDIEVEHEWRKSGGSGGSGTGRRTLTIGVSGNDVKRFTRGMNQTFPAYANFDHTGYYGDYSASVTREFQRRVGIQVDGIVGPVTRAKLAEFGVRF